MATSLFVNLPVNDVTRARAFFSALGYRFDERFSNEHAACLVIADGTYAMLLAHPFFQTFTPKPISDARHATEVLVALSAESKDEVDRMCEAAFAAGARRYKEPEDQGFMYGWGFEDPDGHIWEYFWMQPAA